MLFTELTWKGYGKGIANVQGRVFQSYENMSRDRQQIRVERTQTTLHCGMALALLCSALALLCWSWP